MNKLWMTADLHAFHANVIQYCNRPFANVNEMNNTLINNWNELVEENDTILVLGDMFVGYKPSGYSWFSHQLKGKKILVRGNHDKKTDVVWKNRFGFQAVEDFIIFGKYFLVHYPLIFNPKQTEYEKERIKLLIEAYEQSGCSYVFHGHSHNSPIKEYPKNHYNVGVDTNDFYPIDFKEKIKQLNWL